VEGLCFELRDRLEGCEKVWDNFCNKIIVVGGAAKSNFWMQTKADLLGRIVEVPDNNEAANTGAASLAALGTGIFYDENKAMKYFYKVKRIYLPSKDNSKVWDKRFRYYKNWFHYFLIYIRNYKKGKEIYYESCYF
jgi:xylulokinase